ncbi:MAG TPA: helix-turn-helix domain-containing protein [Pyrinomonadaceae bacterium]|nr:helix-turn-helix domain-containing protein [Pyrinomonadaceae bacterium]
MSTTIWRTEDVSSSIGVHAGSLLHEETLDTRLDALREVALTLLHEVESIRSLRPQRSEQPRLPEAVRRFETHLILAALEKTRGNQFRAARLLGVKHTTLNAKIKRYGISFERYRNAGRSLDQEMAA